MRMIVVMVMSATERMRNCGHICLVCGTGDSPVFS
jgi:hypothetical protein